MFVCRVWLNHLRNCDSCPPLHWYRLFCWLFCLLTVFRRYARSASWDFVRPQIVELHKFESFQLGKTSLDKFVCGRFVHFILGAKLHHHLLVRHGCDGFAIGTGAVGSCVFRGHVLFVQTFCRI